MHFPQFAPTSCFNFLLRVLGVVLVGLVPMLGRAGPTASAIPEEYHLPEAPSELLVLDDDMRAFFAARVHRIASPEKRLDEISAAILGEDGLHFRYESEGTYDVREAFRRRSGNCVTYSMLVVAVAREYRLPARFNEVITRRRWSRAGELVLESRHINVWVEVGTVGYEIDLQLRDDLRASRFYSQPISDERAFAGLYSNDGIFRLAAGRTAEAMCSFRRSVGIDPRHPVVWSNMGNACLILGNEPDAQACFERALALDSSSGAAVSGLARIHRAAGRSDEADRFERAARRYRERNPYYLWALARSELASGDAESARRHLARALRLKRDEPDFHAEMIAALRALGRDREAARWSRRLAALEQPEAVAMR